LTTIRDIYNLNAEGLDEHGNSVTFSTEIVFWNGKERVELQVEAIDYAAGKSGMIILSPKTTYNQRFEVTTDGERYYIYDHITQKWATYSSGEERSFKFSKVAQTFCDKLNTPLAVRLDERVNEHDQERETP